MVNIGLECDIENILQRRENEEFHILRRLSAFCQDYQLRVAASVDTCAAQEREYARKYKGLSELIARLHGAEKERSTEIEDVVLRQKVTDKKITIATKQRAKLDDEIGEAKLRKESIALRMVDLGEEIEVSRKRRKDRWNAIKMACTYYKENLDFYIDLKQRDDYDGVGVTFFRRKNPAVDGYRVNFNNYENTWKVERIEPELEEKHSDEIKAKIDWTKNLDVLETVAFLCKLRNILWKHYFKR